MNSLNTANTDTINTDTNNKDKNIKVNNMDTGSNETNSGIPLQTVYLNIPSPSSYSLLSSNHPAFLSSLLNSFLSLDTTYSLTCCHSTVTFSPLLLEPTRSGFVNPDTNIILLSLPIHSPSLYTPIFDYSIQSKTATVLPVSSHLLPVSPSVSNTLVIYTSYNHLARLGCFHEDWIEVLYNDTIHLYQIFGTDDLLNDTQTPILYTSQLNFYNLIQSFSLCNVDVTIQKPSVNVVEDLQIAVELDVKLVDSGLSFVSLDECLFQLSELFRSTTQIVRLHDYIAVSIDKNIATLKSQLPFEMAEINELDLSFVKSKNALETVYFQVTRLEPSGRMPSVIHPETTRVVHAGTVHSFVPDGILSNPFDILGSQKFIDTDSPFHDTDGNLISKNHDENVTVSFDNMTSISNQNPTNKSKQIDINPENPVYKTLTNLFKLHSYPKTQTYNIQTTILIHGPPHTGKKFIIDYCAKQHHYHQIQLNCFLLLRDSIDATTTELYRHKKRILDASPCIVVLTHLEAFTESWTDSKTNDMKSILKSFFESLKPTQSPYPIIIIATVHDIDSIDPELRSLFTHTIACRVPDEQDRLMILNNMMVDVEVDINVSVRHVALQTAGLNALDLKHGLVSAGYNTIKRVLGLGFDVDVVAKAGVGISRPDILKSIDQSRSEHSDSIGAPKIPTVYWEDIGGLSHVKDTILETIQLPLIHPELFSSGVKKRSGVLLYGPPGTGKTLVAKAVATTLGLNFFSVKGPELLNMYIGESEANVRKVFQKARDAKPCIIFFDELDSVAPQRGSKGDSGGVMDRIVSQLLSELDGMGSSSDIFVIGATNRPDLLDSSLLRPGRFDKLLFLGVSDTNEQQLQLIQALTRKFKLHSDCDLLALVDKCPFIYSGADFYALCSDTLLKSMTRKISEIQRLVMEWNESGPHLPHPHPTSSVYFLDHVYEGSVEVEIRMQDFEDALEELVPSITPAELERYAKLKSLFEPGNE